MTKLLILSDLHRDHRPFEPVHNGRRIDAQADVVILAGDIDEGSKGLRWARQAFPDKPIVYVAGNHEFYGQRWFHLIDNLREVAKTLDIHFLEDEVATIEGLRFLGCSLWTDFALYGDAQSGMEAAQRSMNDYERIKVGRNAQMYWVQPRKLVPSLTVARHRHSVAWLDGQLGDGDLENTIVVTHHAPHPMSVAEGFRGDALNPAYASDLSHLMGKAPLWIHGHMHQSVDAVVSGTRIVCNPRGYMRRDGAFENGNFEPEFVVGVGAAPRLYPRS